MRTNIGDLSKAEWGIMRICWEKGKSSAKVIFEESLKIKKRKYNTIRTILERLVIKGYLEHEMFGPIWLYTPIKNKKTATSVAIDDFIKTVLNETIAPIFIHVVNKKKYRKEIEELKRLLNDKEEQE